MPQNGAGKRRVSDSSSNVRRRRVLKTLGATGIAALAGCSGDGNSGGGGGGDGGDGGDADTTTTGTATATAAPNQITVDYWTLFSGGDGETMASMVDQFNEDHDDIQIRRQRIPWDQYYDKLYTSLTGGNAPDLAICHLSRMRRFGPVFEPLSDTIDASSYYETSVSEATIEGEVRSAPLDILGAGTYYNKSIFEDAGLDPEQSMGSWSEYEQKISTINSETDKIAYDPGADLHGSRVYYGWIRQMGHQILEEDGDSWTMGWSEDDAMTILNTIDMMSSNEWFPKDPDQAFGQFQNNGSAAINGGTWDYNNYKDVEDLEWGFMKSPPAPGMGTDQNKTWGNSHSIGVPRNDNRSDEVLQAAKTAAKSLTQDYGLTWGTSAGHIPNATAAREAEELREADVWDKTMESWVESLENDEFIYFPRTQNNGQYHEAIYQSLNAVRNGNMAPEDAYNQIQQDVDAV